MGTESRFELMVFWRTSAGYRVRVALGLKNLPVTERLIDLDAGQQRSDSFPGREPARGHSGPDRPWW